MMSPSQLEYKTVMNENLNGNVMDKRILSFKEKPPKAPEGSQSFSDDSLCEQLLLCLGMQFTWLNAPHLLLIII